MGVKWAVEQLGNTGYYSFSLDDKNESEMEFALTENQMEELYDELRRFYGDAWLPPKEQKVESLR